MTTEHISGEQPRPPLPITKLLEERMNQAGIAVNDSMGLDDIADGIFHGLESILPQVRALEGQSLAEAATTAKNECVAVLEKMVAWLNDAQDREYFNAREYRIETLLEAIERISNQ